MTQRRQEQGRLSQIRALDLRGGREGASAKIVLCVEPLARPRLRSARTAGPLDGARLADLRRDQRPETGPRVVLEDPREARVDHARDGRDRDGALGDIGREDDLAAPGGRDDATLIRRLHIAMQREDIRAVVLRDVRATRFGPANLARPGEKAEHVPLRLNEAPPDAAADLHLERPTVLALGVAYLDREGATRDRERRGIEVVREGLGIERRAHDDKREIPSSLRAGVTREGEAEICRDTALVKFIEDDGRDPGEVGL